MMRITIFLVALFLSSASVLRAQYPCAAAQFDTQMSQASSAQQQRDQQANSTASAPRKFAPYTGLDGKLYQYPANPTKENVWLWKEARAARKQGKRQEAREKDEAKNGKRLPGGFRVLENGDLVNADGFPVNSVDDMCKNTDTHGDKKQKPSNADAKRNKMNQKLLDDLNKAIKDPN